MLNGNTVESVDNFVYLGSMQSSDRYCRPDTKRRIGLASLVMSSLRTIWTDKRLSLSIKLRVYQTLILSVLLYVSETWTVLAADAGSLESFHVKCQRHILGIRWHDRIRNTEITERTGLPPLLDQITRRCNSLFGHVARLGNDTPAHQALRRQIDVSLGWLPDRTWKRPPGRPRSK